VSAVTRDASPKSFLRLANGTADCVVLPRGDGGVLSVVGKFDGVKGNAPANDCTRKLFGLRK
jgi:hypothetical protein